MIETTIDYSTLDNVPFSSDGRPSALNNPSETDVGVFLPTKYRIALQKKKYYQ